MVKCSSKEENILMFARDLRNLSGTSDTIMCEYTKMLDKYIALQKFRNSSFLQLRLVATSSLRLFGDFFWQKLSNILKPF